jgi:hypothetical protein
MIPNISRRSLLKSLLVGAGSAIAAGALSTPMSVRAATPQADAARAFLESLGRDRAKATLKLDDAARTDWHWFPPQNFSRREGVPLAAMSAKQKDAALALLRSLTTQTGYDKALAIMSLQKDLGRDDGAYFFSVFGEPSATGAWAVGVEGHHLSLNYAINGATVSAAPVFLGASPTRVLSGPRKDLRALRVEEDAARSLVRSLSPALQREALFAALTPGDTISRNAVSVKPPALVGIRGEQMNAEQRALALSLVDAYCAVLPEAVAKARRERAQAEFASVRFGWAGSLNAGERYYYRLQGAAWMIDHDNSRDGGKHIHSQWREFRGDFGVGVL